MGVSRTLIIQLLEAFDRLPDFFSTCTWEAVGVSFTAAQLPRMPCLCNHLVFRGGLRPFALNLEIHGKTCRQFAVNGLESKEVAKTRVMCQYISLNPKYIMCFVENPPPK